MSYQSGTDLVMTQGQDFAFQVWVTDHRSEPVPYTTPAKMTVKDKLGQILFETTDAADAAGAEAVILTSPINGLVQVSIPRSMSVDFTAGTYAYDIWATIVDADTLSMFPDGQLVPVASGLFVVRTRTTVMEAPTP